MASAGATVGNSSGPRVWSAKRLLPADIDSFLFAKPIPISESGQ